MSTGVEAAPDVGREKPTRSLGKCQAPNLHIPTVYLHTLWVAYLSPHLTQRALFLYFSIIWFGSFCVRECVCVCFPLAIGTRCVSGVVFKQAGGDPDKQPSEASCTRTRTLKAGDLKMDLHAHWGLRSIATNIYSLDC